MGKSAKIAIATIMLVLIAGGIYWAVQANSVEGQARKVVDKYVKAIKYRESTDDLTSGWVDGPIDVIDYEFLRVVSKEEQPKLVEVTRQMYADIGTNNFGSYEEYVQFYKDIYDNAIVSEGLDRLVLDTGEDYTEIKLLYDMELVNGLGQTLRKKVVVTTVDEFGKMQITDFNIE